jgi:hypothetical protein
MAGDCVERFQLKGAVSFQKIRAKVRLARATERWGRMPFHDIQNRSTIDLQQSQVFLMSPRAIGI